MGEAITGIARVDVYVFTGSSLVAGVCQVVTRPDDLARPLELCVHEWEMFSGPCGKVIVVFSIPLGGFLPDLVVFATRDDISG